MAVTRIWQGLSLEPKRVDSASWPKTFGIWVYADIAFAVAVTYVLNQGSTPPAIKSLAIAFGGYVAARAEHTAGPLAGLTDAACPGRPAIIYPVSAR